MERTLYTRDEEALVTAALASGAEARCPRCDLRLELHDVTPREGVPYLRRRIWLTCGSCGRSLVVDRRRVSGGDR
jgi:hypothetical protein